MMLGLLAGVVLGQSAWLVGALLGAVLGWLIERVQRLSAQVKDLQRLVAVQPAAAATARVPSSSALARPADAPAPAVTVSAPPAPAPALPPQSLAAAAALGQPPAQAAPSAAESVPARDAAVAAPAPNFLVHWLFGGNTVVRAGVVILFFGVAFLLKFAYEHSHLPVELRLIGVSLGAMALLIVGWRLRDRRPGYALTLQGGGVGLLYLTIFAAFRLYTVLPVGPAFVLLVLLAACAALLAVLQDSLALAVAGASGGFLAPILASTGHGSHILLFSYYIVLNLGILAVAWKKAWRVLNLVGFLFTFVIGLLWGANDYQPELFASTEPFLGIFFLIYFLIPLLVARQAGDGLAPYVDATVVFGVPIVAFGLQAALVRDFEYGAAWSALGLGAFYLLAATAVWRRYGAGKLLLAEAFTALGGGLATLAIPLAFDGRTTSAVWAVEGAGVVWVGLRQNRVLARLAGYTLQILAGVAFVLAFDNPLRDLPILNSRYLGCALIALSAWWCSACATRELGKLRGYESAVPAIMMIWGALWWVGGGMREIDRHLDRTFFVHATLLFLSASAVAWSALARTLAWPVARWGAYALVPVMTLGLLFDLADFAHPLGKLGYAAWPLALVAHLWVLRRHEGQDRPLLELLHPAGLWILAALLSREFRWQIDAALGAGTAWGLVPLGLVPAALLWLLNTSAVRGRWPVATNARAYLVTGAMPIAACLLFWTVWANLASDGDAAPLPYFFLLNPLDVSLGLVFLTLARWFEQLRRDGQDAALGENLVPVYCFAGAAVFLWINGIVLRGLHQWASVPFDFNAMWHSVLVQAAFSLVWSLTALLLMTVATRRALREIWLVGAIVMGIVVVKLFAIDLSNVGGVERIVSFLGVGALMLVIGYVAPVPPRMPVDSAGAGK
jgi:uncharacterized membrane protein